ncbi:DNA/RNA helicase domain-containing protein [Nocardiopsis eucommiae]|uniref:DNA/RNA helicase domain-containing protein n=1 Tax=Nocardiopsis eucommiae TaxID=2831970 RepID=UPI003D750419
MLDSADGNLPRTPPATGDRSGIPAVAKQRPRYLLVEKASDLHAMDTHDLVMTLEYRAKTLYQTNSGSAERKSWAASIKTVTAVLMNAGLGDVLVLLEMSTLVSNKRIDMVLLGSHPATGDMSMVIVENKQWSYMRPIAGTELVDHPGAPNEGSLHPLDQAWGYGRTLEKNLPMLGGNWACVANLHNAASDQVEHPASLPTMVDPERAKLFGAGREERQDFAEFLTTVLSAEGAPAHLRLLNAAHVRPSDEVMRAVNKCVRERGSFFPLLEEQRTAFRKISHALDQKFSENDKNVFIIVGGPGTGKSVLALELYGNCGGIGSTAVHASGSTSFAKALRHHVVGDPEDVEEMFTYFDQHRHRARNQLNVLLCDEAHRLRKNSNRQYMPKEHRQDTPQVHELIDAARVPVFFLDPYQVVRRDEVGTPENIRDAAIDLGIRPENIHEIDLKTQFRQYSCPDYLDWLEALLGYRDAQPQPWTYQGPYQLLAAANPAEMETYLRLQAALGSTARLTAGYCWPWTKKTAPGGGLIEDVQIGDWACAWNSPFADTRNGIPGTAMWATDSRGLDQVGCIYTAQGLEWGYSGVIMGRDFTWTGSGWKAQKGNDSTIWGEKLHAMVRNIYRVLATRGRDGMVLYSTDAATRELFASLGVPPLAPALEELQRLNPDVVAPKRGQRLSLF